MKPFVHKSVNSFEEASALLEKAKDNEADVMAGGTDLLNGFKHAILAEHPDFVINLKTIPDSDGISDDGASITVKAMTKLTDIAESPVIQKKAAALGEAAYSVATPLVRNMGTIGGNICQDVRCWYYRYPHEAGGRMV